MPAPLSPPVFWILTALTGARRHGYEILRETTQASGGRVTLKVTTLYSALERLERDGLIASDGEEIVSGRARRYYVLTDGGAASLSAEVEALETQARVARAKLAASRPAAAPGRAVLS
jgi:PadR family transcriptional regulator, regulatory protein PadR